MPNGNDIEREFERERWRGQTDRRSMDHEEDLRKLWLRADDADERISELAKTLAVIDKSVAVVDARLALLCAGGSFVGGALVAFAQHFLK